MDEKDGFEIINNEIVVEEGNEKFYFKNPSVMEMAKWGVTARAIRRSLDPSFSGDLHGLDAQTTSLTSTLAALQLFLLRADASWVFVPAKEATGNVKKGEPVVDIDTYGPELTDKILNIGIKFESAVGRFRQGGLTNRDSAG